MKKLKLILTAFALLLGWNGAWGQAWTTGATVSTGEYYLYNVGSDRFLNRGHNYYYRSLVDRAGSVVTLSADGDNYFIRYNDISNKYFGSDLYADKATNNANYSSWAFEAVSVDGYTNVYRLKCVCKGSNKDNNNKYLVWCGNNTDSNTDWSVDAPTANGYWLLIPKDTREDYSGASSSNPFDMTYVVKNADFEQNSTVGKNDEANLNGWTKEGDAIAKYNAWNTAAGFGTFWEQWTDGANDGHLSNRELKQTVTSLPSGKYKVTVSALAAAQGKVDKSDVSGATFSVNGSGQSVATGESSRTFTFNDISVTDGNLTLSYKLEDCTANWIALDNVRLYYVEPYISAIATAFTSGSTMTAGSWYYFTAGASDKRISASTPGDIVITTDGNELTTGGTALNSYTGKLVSGTKYYIKSSSAQTVTIETSVPSLAEGTYFFKVAKAHNGTSEVDAVPAGKYLARGRSYGTHATVDTYGLPIEVAVLANGYYTLSPADTKRFYYHASSWDCWADKDAVTDQAMFELTQTNGMYKIHNVAMASGRYLKYNTSEASEVTVPIYDDGTGTNNGPYILWTAESLSDHATAMTALKNSQAATAAAAAYASGNYSSLNGITTISGLETALESYVQGDFVSASAIESIQEKYQGSQPGSSNIVETVYSNTIDITQAGLYKFSMQAFYRAASNATTQALHTAGADFPPVVLYFGSAETQIKSIYDEGGLDQGIAEGYFETETVGGAPVEYNGKYYTNGQHNSVIIFQKDYYHNDVWLYVSEPGTYSYGVKYMGWANESMQWFIYSPESVTITSYAEAATSADYTALSAAISAYDEAEWGFDKDECAPYNNINAINNIATARAINSGETNSKLLVNSLTNYLALTVNAADADAIYNGNFATLAEGENYPKGWTRTNGWGEQHGDLPASSGASTEYGYYNQPGSLQYGNQGAYTMPLNANTVYTLTFKYASFDEKNPNSGMTVTVLNGSSEGGQAVNFDGNSTLYNTSGAFVTKTLSFATQTAGNYVLTLANSGNTVMTDVSITKAANQYLEFADGSLPT